jgi:hypothetical protein
MIYVKCFSIDQLQDKEEMDIETTDTNDWSDIQKNTNMQEESDTTMIQFHGMNMSLEEIENDIQEIKQEIGDFARNDLYSWENPYDLFLYAQLLNLEESLSTSKNTRDSQYARFNTKPIMHFSILMATSLTCPPCLFSKTELKKGDPANWYTSLREFKNKILNHLLAICQELIRSPLEKKYNIPISTRNKFTEIYLDIDEEDVLHEITKVFEECFYCHLVFATFQELEDLHLRNQKYFAEYDLQFLSKIKSLRFQYFPTFFKLLFDAQLLDRRSEYGNPVSLVEYLSPKSGVPPLFMQNAFKSSHEGKMTNLTHWLVEKPESIVKEFYEREIKRTSSEAEKVSIIEKANQQISALRSENIVKTKFIENLAEYFLIRLVQELK